MDRDDAATIDGFVLHWRLVEPATVDDVPDFLRTSASGYPTIAYTGPARLAARMRGKTWERPLAEELAREATAIIVSLPARRQPGPPLCAARGRLNGRPAAHVARLALTAPGGRAKLRAFWGRT